jgi:hypothetical protein
VLAFKLLTLLKYLHTGYAGVCLQFRSLTLPKVSQQEKGLTCRICKHTPDTLVLFRSLTLLLLFKSLTLSKYLHLEKGLACRICKHTLVTLVCVCHQDDWYRWNLSQVEIYHLMIDTVKMYHEIY